ncbi:hypothetical protein [Streptomyces sp. cf124]|uniref:hypothetical protein n=1 Tax=Streptomyces sp. cf124 TaxID=1761903 RepID=UPI000B8A0FBA|nr:hypothetical protein [Streptomyces sp. cf124]
MKVFDVGLAASVAEFAGQELGESGCLVLAACASDGDVAGTGGEAGVVGEAGNEFAGAGDVQDDFLKRVAEGRDQGIFLVCVGC